MLFKLLTRLFALGLLMSFVPPCRAASVLVAVASDFTRPMADIAGAFTEATGHTAKLSFGSTDKFVARIENGAPFELLLSADEKSPKRLEEAGLAEPGTHFTYAVGKLVLWSADETLVDAGGKILRNGGFRHLAVANPKLSPYGLAAEQTLKNLNLFNNAKPLFLFGDTVDRTRQLIDGGDAELGFIALSQVIGGDGAISRGSAWIVPDNLYQPIRQGAVLLKHGERNPAARALWDFLRESTAREIIKRYGYDAPVER